MASLSADWNRMQRVHCQPAGVSANRWGNAGAATPKLGYLGNRLRHDHQQLACSSLVFHAGWSEQSSTKEALLVRLLTRCALFFEYSFFLLIVLQIIICLAVPLSKNVPICSKMCFFFLCKFWIQVPCKELACFNCTNVLGYNPFEPNSFRSGCSSFPSFLSGLSLSACVWALTRDTQTAFLSKFLGTLMETVKR